MTHEELRQRFYRNLSPHYAQGELQALYHWCVEELEGWSRVEAYGHNSDEVTEDQQKRWDEVCNRLQKHEPVQYIFNRAAFFDMQLYVDSNVLIPRPETEELVQLVLHRFSESKLRVLDIGTGSGCIALALKKARTDWNVSGCDVSIQALEVANRNARTLDLGVGFFEADTTQRIEALEEVDIIISNPPYIPVDREQELEKNVVDFEPHVALFAPREDAFFFFQQIVQRAIELHARAVFFETHATQTEELIENLKPLWPGHITTAADLSGKSRFVLLIS